MRRNALWILMVSCLVAALAVLPGCGDDDDDVNDTDDTSTQTDDTSDTGADTSDTGVDTSDTGDDTGADTNDTGVDTNDTGEATDDTATIPEVNVTVTVKVPDDFSATPNKIFATFYTKDPPVGMPDVFADSAESPDIGPGKPYVFTTKNHKAYGDVFLSIALFVDESFGPAPVNGSDWSGITEKFTIGDVDVDAGEITLSIHQGAGSTK